MGGGVAIGASGVQQPSNNFKDHWKEEGSKKISEDGNTAQPPL